MAKVLWDHELMLLVQDIDPEAATRVKKKLITAYNEAADAVANHFGLRHGEADDGCDLFTFMVDFYSDGPDYPRELSAYDPAGSWVGL